MSDDQLKAVPRRQVDDDELHEVPNAQRGRRDKGSSSARRSDGEDRQRLRGNGRVGDRLRVGDLGRDERGGSGRGDLVCRGVLVVGRAERFPVGYEKNQ